MIFQVDHAQTGTRQRGDSDALRIADEVQGFSGLCRDHGGAVVESGAQVPPFPVAQNLRGRVELAGGIGDVVMRKCGNRGRDPRPVGLISGDALPLVRKASVFVRHSSVGCGTQGKKDGNGRSHEKRREDARRSDHQRPVPPSELAELIQHRSRPGQNRFATQVAPDVRRQIPRRGVAPRLVFLQRLADDDLDVAAVKRVDRAQPRWFLLSDHPCDLVQPEAARGGTAAGAPGAQRE